MLSVLKSENIELKRFNLLAKENIMKTVLKLISDMKRFLKVFRSCFLSIAESFMSSHRKIMRNKLEKFSILVQGLQFSTESKPHGCGGF